MNEEQIKNAENCYGLAELRASDYFRSLYDQVLEKSYVSALTKDFQQWKKRHLYAQSIFPLFSRRKQQPNLEEYHNYIQWLNYSGKLDHYLERSVAYIYMRDLGKALDSPDEQNRIQDVVEYLKIQLLSLNLGKSEEKSSILNLAGLYRQAQKEGLESTVIWLVDKIRTVSAHIPEGLDAEQAQRKLIKIIGGVLMHQIEELDQTIPPEERKQKLDVAIRLGYSYGLTYPFIDDLLDSGVLSGEEKKQYSDLIRTTLITGIVPELEQWDGNNRELIEYIHIELREAYDYIRKHQKAETLRMFFDQAYVFFNAQEKDRDKMLSNPRYTNEEIYIPVILKSASSRMIARSVISPQVDQGFDQRTFFYGIYNQLADDFTDLYDDLEAGAVTPYTYYLKHHKQRGDLVNPFELYWTVIANLIHHVYHSDSKTCEVILDRAINGLKRYKKRMGVEKYNAVMAVFSSGSPPFDRMIQKMVEKADDVDFFDKLLRDQMLVSIRNEKRERDEFSDMVKTARDEINRNLKIVREGDGSTVNETIIDAANFSLEGGGKRLRPIVAWFMGVNEYGLKKTDILPLLRALEYMHTASLIYDDLPSQDDAATRRGQPTLHREYDVATAELTALFLTQKAIEEQASLDRFESKTVLEIIRYSTQVTKKMCRGQGMDLGSKGKLLTKEQLDVMALSKTGLAFEASLVMLAMLAQATETEIAALKEFAHHAGIAFQIKDDLLDVEGNPAVLGKPVGQDAENSHSTYVSILGLEGARIELWERFSCATEAMEKLRCKTPFLKQLLNYIVHRDS